MDNKYISAKVVNFHYKEPTLDSIGYDGIKPAICVPRSYFISAHAPSKIVVKFKEGGKVYINCNVNRTTAIPNDSTRYIVKCGVVTLLNVQASLEYHPLQVIKDLEYTFEIATQSAFGAHTLWNFFHANEALSPIESQALQDVNKMSFQVACDYSLYIQTCNPRKKMAFRCLTSFLNNVGMIPKRVVVCSLDNINDGGIPFPNITEFITGRQDIFNKLHSKGVSSECINHIFNGFKNNGNPNMWLKYIVPRLCFGKDRVLVLDDDVATLGKCEGLLTSPAYLTFMNDSSPFYGERTIDYFNATLGTTKHCKKEPYVCAGVYMMNNAMRNHNVEFINGLILKSEHDTDEQSAVGMELFESDYKVLKHPEYHHGGWEDQKIDFEKLNLIHMQGRASKYREDLSFTELFMKRRNGK